MLNKFSIAGVPDIKLRLEDYKYQVRHSSRSFTVHSSICFGLCRLLCHGEPRFNAVLSPDCCTSLTLPNQRTTPPPASVFRHRLSGPLPASYLCYRTPEAGLLVSKEANDCQISPMSSEEGLSSTITDWLFINSWWLLLPFIMLLVVAAFIVAFVLLLYMISPLISPKPLKLNGAHVVVSAP